MGNEILVSVVLCTYNDERFIAKAIDSVLNQTFRNFEFIIWNDGSTDNTEKIVKEYNDPRIKYFYHENVGVGKAAQLACRKANGKYIARIDSDDICLPERLNEEVNFLERHPDYVAVSSSVFYIDESDNIIGRTFPATSAAVIKKMLPSVNPIVHSSSMYRKEAYDRSGGYIGIRQREDHFLFSRLIKYGKMKNLTHPLVMYRIRSNSLSHYEGHSDYGTILKTYWKKMVKDEQILSQDVELFNSIYLYSKQFSEKQSRTLFKSKKSYEEGLYQVLKLGGERNAEIVVCFVKNIYNYLKYH